MTKLVLPDWANSIIWGTGDHRLCTPIASIERAAWQRSSGDWVLAKTAIEKLRSWSGDLHDHAKVDGLNQLWDEWLVDIGEMT